MTIDKKVKGTLINGKEYFTAVDVALLTNRSLKTVDNWCRIGNSENYLKAEKMFGQWMIERYELEQFVVTPPGRPSCRDKGTRRGQLLP